MSEEENFIPSMLVAMATLDFRKLVAELLDYLKLSVPMSVMMSIFNARGLALAARKQIGRVRWTEEHLEVPGRYVPDVGQEWRLAAKYLNDRLWNAFRLEGCDFFDDQGEWVYSR